MNKLLDNISPKSVEKKASTEEKKLEIYDEKSDSFLKLISEIIVEIIIKETSNESNRIRQDQ
jgi:hypothetical protein